MRFAALVMLSVALAPAILAIPVRSEQLQGLRDLTTQRSVMANSSVAERFVDVDAPSSDAM